MKYHRLITKVWDDEADNYVEGAPHPIERTPHLGRRSLGNFDVDLFQLDADWHNGPRCVDCRAAKCTHCSPHWWLGPCNA